MKQTAPGCGSGRWHSVLFLVKLLVWSLAHPRPGLLHPSRSPVPVCIQTPSWRMTNFNTMHAGGLAQRARGWSLTLLIYQCKCNCYVLSPKSLFYTMGEINVTGVFTHFPHSNLILPALQPLGA